MNKIQKTTLALVGLGAIAASGLTFAADSGTSATDASVRPRMGQGFQRGGGMGQRSNFFRTDLTDAEKTALKTLMDAQRAEIKKFFDDNKATLSDANTIAALKALQDAHTTALLPYVAADKIDAFKAASANVKPGMMGVGGGRGQGAGNGIINGGGRGSMISKTISDKLDAKLAAMPDSATKITWLQNVNTKIDALASKVSGQKTKNLLNEFKNLINNKIDELSGNTVDENTLSKILD